MNGSGGTSGWPYYARQVTRVPRYKVMATLLRIAAKDAGRVTAAEGGGRGAGRRELRASL